MNWVDIVILVLVIGFGFMGWRNGVIRLVFTLVGGIVGLVLAGQLFDDLAPLVPIGDKEGVQQLIAFGVIFLAVLIGAWIAARLVKAVIAILLLGWVDSLAGLAIGVLIGAFASTAFISAAGIVPSQSVQDAVAESQLAEPLSDNLGFVRGLLPEEFDSVGDLLDRGASLVGKGADLLGQVEKLESQIEQGQGFCTQPVVTSSSAGRVSTIS